MDLERFVADCIAANNDPHPQAAVLEVLAEAIHNPSAMLAAVHEPSGLNVKFVYLKNNPYNGRSLIMD